MSTTFSMKRTAAGVALAVGLSGFAYAADKKQGGGIRGTERVLAGIVDVDAGR